jgi:hypothetical protein
MSAPAGFEPAFTAPESPLIEVLDLCQCTGSTFLERWGRVDPSWRWPRGLRGRQPRWLTHTDMWTGSRA